MAEISIIVRTFNEERWISHCLAAIAAQEFRDWEVIIVDNASTDHTVAVAKRFHPAKIIALAKYLPGLSLNEGIRAGNGRFIVCLSAHCVPRDSRWLSTLLKNFDDERVAGVYGRQLPVAFTGDLDKRDLMTVFGLDRRVQIKDYFFHNANSMLRRDLWERVPFDETLTNIEDRVWGKAMIEAGYRLVYEPDAAVYHHHGLHQGNDPRRARGVVSIIASVDREGAGSLPESLLPERCHIAAIAPLRGPAPVVAGVDLLERLLDEFQQSKYLKSVHLFSEADSVRDRAKNRGLDFIPRPPELAAPDRSIEDVMRYCLGEIERKGIYPEAILLADCLYPFRPAGLFDELIRDAQFKGLDTVFPAFVEYSNIWRRNEADAYVQVGEGLMSRQKKEPMYRALYGLGCVSAAAVIRSGHLVGDRVGILPVQEIMHTLRQAGSGSRRIIEILLRHGGDFFAEPVIGACVDNG
ncbi:MAG: glycosyltransferase [Magnetococcales bacterium]|nr:glycosyltransferase [Magnetococcales bacterium]